MILAVFENCLYVCIRGVFSRFLAMLLENMKDGERVCWERVVRGYIERGGSMI
jgi:hypothetical protein